MSVLQANELKSTGQWMMGEWISEVPTSFEKTVAVLRPVSTSANSAAQPSDWLSGHAQLESKLKASVYWRTRGQFWKLNQVQLFRDLNERKPISLRLFNARACDRTGSRDQTRRSGNRPLGNQILRSHAVAKTKNLTYHFL